MKRLFAVLAALVLLSGIPSAHTEGAPEEISWTTRLTVRFATIEEGRQKMRERTLFHDQISEEILPFYLQRKGGTVSEYIEYSEEQVEEFTPSDRQRISDALSWLRQQLEKHGLQIPDPGEITVVKSTGQEISGAAGYTSEGTIFLNSLILMPEYYYTESSFRDCFVHELFHCLTRLYPGFRQAMYSLIHFRVLDEDIEVPEEIRKYIIANPDVEHHNSCAAFTIGGEKTDCYLVFLTDSVFEKPGDTLFDGMYSGIVPLDGSRVYRNHEVDDFWDVVGRNTDYAEDPEEIMASNFALSISHLDDGYAKYSDPGIPEGIVDYLKTGSAEIF